MKSRRLLLTLAVIAVYALHKNVWLWRTARPLVFGFLPIGLFYQACFSVAAALLLAALVRYAWPGHLDTDSEPRGERAGLTPASERGVPGVRRSTPRHDE